MLELLLLVSGWRPQVGAGCWGDVSTLDTLHCVQQPGNGVGGRHAQTCNNDIIINHVLILFNEKYRGTDCCNRRCSATEVTKNISIIYAFDI